MKKSDAAHEFVKRDFSTIPQALIFRDDCDLYDEFDFYGKRDEWEDESEKFGPVGVPMWGWVFLVTDSSVERRILADKDAVCDLGFTIIEDYENGYIMLGIDAAGFSFYDAFWEPLYDLMGLHWHDED